MHTKGQQMYPSQKKPRILFIVEDELKMKVKRKCLKVNLSMTDVLTTLLENWVKEK